MPWFKIDDKAHSHPKFMRVGNAALGLWLRCGSYSAQHVTEGIVPGQVAQLYGTAPQIAKLVKAGLWHAAGHTCPRCPQPADGDYVFHDFFEDGRNTSRDRYEEDKRRARDRAAKSRAGRKSDSNAEVSVDDSSSNRSVFEDESSSKKTVFSDSAAGQEGLSQRTPAGGVTDPHAAAMPYPGTSYGSTAAARGDRSPTGGVPNQLQPLRDALAAAGLGAVAWDIKKFTDWERIRIQMERLGIPVMVRSACNAARQRGEPDSVTAWISRWETLADPPPDSNGEVVPIHNAASRQQQETDDLFDRAMARAHARMQQETS